MYQIFEGFSGRRIVDSLHFLDEKVFSALIFMMGGFDFLSRVFLGRDDLLYIYIFFFPPRGRFLLIFKILEGRQILFAILFGIFHFLIRKNIVSGIYF